MAITRVQEISGIGTGTTASATFSSGSAPGNLLIAVVLFRAGTVTAPTSFSTAISNTNTNGLNAYIFYFPNATSTTTISATSTTTARWIIFIAEYSGLLTSSVLDATGTGTIATGATPSGNVTTNFTNELVVAGLGDRSGDSYSSPTGGFTLVDSTTSGITAGGAYLDLTTATSISTYSTSANNADGGNGVIASFKSTNSTAPQLNAIWSGSVF